MSPADLDALREGLAEAFWNARYGPLADAAWEAAVRSATAIPDGQAAEAMRATYRRANDFLSSPTVADLIAKAWRVDAAEKERDEAREEADNLREGLARLIAEQVRAALAATQPDTTEAPASAGQDKTEGGADA